MSRRFAVVHEAEADFHTATELADRVLMEAIDWLDEYQIAYQREWVGTVPGGHRLTWKTIAKLARETGIRAHNVPFGEPHKSDAAAARRAILYLKEAIPGLKAILLIRDQDNDPERRIGLEQARGQDHGGMVIVVGLAVVTREAWVISGFDPQDGEETARLEAERQVLGFDPRLKSHELTAHGDDQATRSPKRVLWRLSGDNRERERSCWTDTPLERLRKWDGENGLAAYLHEVRDRLAPLIGYIAEG
jgi:hypothetical protein